MKTFILTDNVLTEPLKIQAESYESALDKVSEFYRNQIDPITVAENEYDMQLFEVDNLEELETLI